MRIRVSVSLAVFTALLAGFASEAFAQGAFALRLNGRDGAGGIDTILFGRDPRGTYCVDPVTFYEGTRAFTEFELPPAPPGGVFDLRWTNHRSGLGGCTAANERGNGLRFDIRESTGPAQVDTFTIRFQPGASGPITVGWTDLLPVYCDSARLRDNLIGILVNVDMFGQSSYTVTNPAISNLNVIMYGARRPALLTPASGATVPPTVTLSWSELVGALRYRLQVATDSTFAGASLLVHDSLITGTSREVSGLSSPGTFYWRVSAGTGAGWTAFSALRVFRTGSVPSAPAPVAPPDGAVNQPPSIGFVWTRSPEAATYQLQIGTDSTFAGGIAVNDSTITDTTATIGGLAFGTVFFWRVAGRNDIGAGSWSARRTFTTQLQPPPAPSLISPADGAQNVPIPAPLSWSVTGGGAGLTYRVQVATDAGFTSVVLDDSTVTATTRQVAGLQTTTQYFWKVTAKNLAGFGPSSPVRSFTTVPPLPAAPVLQSPPNNAPDVPITTVFQWGAAAGAATYRLQIATDTGFAARVLDDSTLTTTSRQVGPLNINTVYYWRVFGRNAAGFGPASARFRFTSSAAPPVPLQNQPQDQAVRVSQTPRFVWGPVGGATGYHLQIATDAGFTGLLVNDSTITDTARTAGPFPYGARLWWRIRSRNTAGRSAFSPGWSFTVLLQPPAAAVPLAPANNAGGLPVPTPVRWQAAPLAWWYQLQLAFDTLMTNIAVNDSLVADTSRAVRTAPNTAYYWRVRGINTEGTTGPWSPVRRLTTGNVAPATPIPFMPANNDTNVSRTPMLRWTSSPGALAYRVQVARDNLFTQLVAEDSLLTANQFQPGLLQAQTLYYWRVRARGTAGSSPYAVIQRFTTGSLIVGVEDDGSALPGRFSLLQNYPNPFNPSTTVTYVVPVQADVRLTVYTTLGQEVAVLAEGLHAPGTHMTVWNGKDAGGRPMPSGVYLVRMTAAGGGSAPFAALRKMLLMK